MDIAEKVFKVRGQRSRSSPDQLTYNWRKRTFRRCGVKDHLFSALEFHIELNYIKIVKNLA